jgi:hypothetical protein
MFLVNIPLDVTKKYLDERLQFLEELKQRGECVPYRGESGDIVQHVHWNWKCEGDARPDIVRSCIGLHPHWDIYIIKDKAYRKHSKSYYIDKLSKYLHLYWGIDINNVTCCTIHL